MKKGGFWPFTNKNQSVIMTPNPISNYVSTNNCNICLDNGVLDKSYSSPQNSVWRTCITMNDRFNEIIYVTQKNVIIKSIETFQIPEFNVKINDSFISFKIMIENKYINCFLYICGKWYAMMRLFGKTLNTSYLARTEANRAFFLLENINIDIDLKDPNNGSGLILINPIYYMEVNPKTIFSTSKSKTISLNAACFENINKKSRIDGEDVFPILQRFRQEKLIGNDVKQDIAGEVVENMTDRIFNWF
jgi:hypothetical protein